MIPSEDVFVAAAEVVDRSARKSGSKGGLVLGSRVLTDGGVDIGAVTDVVLEVDEHAEVRGYEIDPTDALPGNRHRALIPLPDTIAVSGEALVVPASITGFVADDLAGFGAAIDAFRAQLSGGTA